MTIHFQKVSFYLLLLMLVSSCNLQNQTAQSNSIEKKVEKNTTSVTYREHDKVTSGLLDKAGNLWFGTSNEGIYRYDGNSFTHFTEQDGLSNSQINAIVEDSVGNLWFGTEDGLTKYDGTSFIAIQIPWDKDNDIKETNWWSPNKIQCLLVSGSGDLWIGTGGFGVYQYDGNTFTNLSFENDRKQADSLHHNFIKSMIKDAKGNIWFTSLTHGGVSRYDGIQTTHFSSKDGLKDDMVFSSFEDKAGNLWFGSIQTKHEGLYRYDGTSFTGFGKEDGLCDNFVTGFFEDRKGQLLIRTGSVLCTYDGKTFSPFRTKEGKELRDINFIIEDKAKNLWMGGRYGHLWKYDGEQLIDFTDKGI